MISYKLYAVTDRSWLREGESLASAVEQAILGGATFVQLREKQLTGNALKELARSVQAVCRAYQIPFVINDNVDLAKEIDADGVHLGQSDMEISIARGILGPDKIVGATAKTVEQAVRAQRAGADYLGSGAIFGTSTKKDAVAMSPALLQEICEAVSIPVVAIGGINGENVAALKGIAIAGPAVVSGIFEKKNKNLAAREILTNLFGRPIIQCITNHVTVNQVANMVLTCSGSPIMSHHIKEVEEMQTAAAGLVLNLGATDDYEAMKLAYRKALELGHSVVIDPVGVSGITFRRHFLTELLSMGSPDCIRGNYAEIKAIYDNKNTGAGLDCELSQAPICDIVRELAKKLGCVIVASGDVDYISDGTNSYEVTEGHPMQKNLTGSGCMLTAAICTEIALLREVGIDIAEHNNTALYTAGVCRWLEGAAARAAKQTIAQEKGILSFQSFWFDELV